MDSYNINFNIKKKIKKLTNKLIVIDDHTHKRHFCDFYINNNFMTKPEEMRIKKLNPSTTLLLGKKYFINNKKLLHLKNLNKKSNKIKNIFVFFGTSDSTNETLKFIKSIKKFTDIKFNILIGKLNKNYRKIKNYCKPKKNVKIFYDLTNDETLKLLQNSQFAFGSGGINLTERLYLGIVSVAICTAKNQKKALIGLHKKKIIHYLGESKNINSLMITKCINNFLNDDSLFKYYLKNTRAHYNKSFLKLLNKKLNLLN